MLKPLLPVALCLALSTALHADALDDELAAIKTLLLEDKVDEASARLDTLEASARVASAANATDPHARYIIGMAALYAGRDAVAKSALDQALRLDPKNVTYIIGRAQFALYTDAPKDAVKLLQDALVDNPKNLPLLEKLGEAQQEAGAFADAQATFQKAADINPKEARYLAEVAQCLQKQNKNDDAIAAYRNALDVNPKYVLAWANLGQIYQLGKTWDKAIEAYTKALELDPNDFRAVAKLIQLNEAAGNPKQRDAARDRIFALFKTGKIPAASFCREQFPDGSRTIMIFEYFELKGPMAVRYAFNFVNPDGKTVDKRVSLGTYDDATNAARQAGTIKPNERMFHLDVYTETAHESLGTFPAKEPTYEETRTLVKQYLAGTLRATPATTPVPSRTTSPVPSPNPPATRPGGPP